VTSDSAGANRPRSSEGRLNFLVTNDDGIDSPGLWALVRACKPVADHIYVVAPKTNQSAVGAGQTLHRELHWERMEDPPVEGVEAWHVDGKPADCVNVAMKSIVNHWIDLVVSGVNQGANMGRDTMASGTVGGALQGHFRGITSAAFSLAMRPGEEVNWGPTERVAAAICKAEANGELPDSVFLNVNIPLAPYEELAGVLVTRVGRSGVMALVQRSGNSGIVERPHELTTDPDIPPGTDVWALAHNYVSVSPLQSNLTDHGLMDELGQQLTRAFER